MNLLIIGCGGHGRVIREISENTDVYDNIKFLDDNYNVNNKGSVIGKLSDYEDFVDEYQHAFVAIGNHDLRHKWQNKLEEAGYTIPTLIHSSAYVSNSAVIEKGTVIMQKAVVQSNARVCCGCIVSVGAIIDHDSVVNEYCHINSGSIVASMKNVPKYTKLDYGEVYK